MYSDSIVEKLKWSLPWLVRYPVWRLQEIFSRSSVTEPTHIIFLIADHFEPGMGDEGLFRLDKWCETARATGDRIRDHDGTAFRHTNFFPAEQYDYRQLEMLGSLQAAGYGEVEVHFHHGVEAPDTSSNTQKILEEFRDRLAFDHRCLSRETPHSLPKYGFVHGNWALANSAGGRFCGVDNEMQILAVTGCYADFTLPSAPDESQVPKLNAIYQCGNPFDQARPHRSGPDLKVGDKPKLPIIFTGPLIFDWSRRVRGLPVPRIDDGALAQNYPLSLERFRRWQSARIRVQGRPNWIFIKLYCHAFFEWDQDTMIGEELCRFMDEVMNLAERSRKFRIHFTSAREAYNLVIAAMEGKTGDPDEYRNYQLRQIMQESVVEDVVGEHASDRLQSLEITENALRN